MQAVVKKWGNSPAVRIPASIMDAVKLHLDDFVDVREEDGRIIIEPVSVPSYDLDELLRGITPENLHGEISFGPVVGNEVL